MTHQEQLNQVRAKIIEAVPEVEEYTLEHDNGEYAYGPLRVKAPVALADVLRTIRSYGITTTLFSHEDVIEFMDSKLDSADWNLAADLDSQEESVISFLHKILCQ